MNGKIIKKKMLSKSHYKIIGFPHQNLFLYGGPNNYFLSLISSASLKCLPMTVQPKSIVLCFLKKE